MTTLRVKTMITTGLLVLLAGLSGAGAAGTSAGTTIRNQATAEAQSGDASETLLRFESNRIETTVQGICVPNITPNGTHNQPGQLATVLPGQSGVLQWVVTNSGNQPNTLNVEWSTDPASTYTPDASRVQLYRMVNGTRQSVTSLTLAADASESIYLEVPADYGSRGSAYLNLTATCGSDLGGASDADNTAELRVMDAANVTLTKTFSPDKVKPGGSTTVDLKLENTASVASQEVVVTDMLTTPELAGMSFVAGSVNAAGLTTEYTADGVAWQTSPTSPVAGVRWRAPSLAPAQQLTINFQMQVNSSASLGERTNVAHLSTVGQPDLSASARVSVAYSPAVALGPVNNARAVEGSADDTQTKDQAVLGRESCFTHTLENTGDVSDQYGLQVRFTSGAGTVAFRSMGGDTLALPLTLAAGAQVDFQACITPSSEQALTLVIATSSAQGAATNQTSDLIKQVVTTLPASAEPFLRKSVSPAGTVQPGVILTYTLEVVNLSSAPLTNLTLRDVLDVHAVFVSATDGGTFNAGTVTWRIPSLAAFETLRITLKVRVAEGAPDGVAVRNRFTTDGERFAAALSSNEVTSPVWKAGLAIQKTADRSNVTVGDKLGYGIRVTNLSTSGTLSHITVTDILPAGLQYIPGTATLNGQPIADPTTRGQQLSWSAGSLPARAEVVIAFQARVTPQAGAALDNVASAQGVSATGAVVASASSHAVVMVQAGIFAPVAELIGVVFVDRNRDGTFDPRVDTPIARARVILADGRVALTDTHGRYHFANLADGVWALRLDPNSVPYAPLSVPQDRGLPGSRSVTLSGLTSVDFPLQANVGLISAARSTTLETGPLTLDKTMDAEGGTCTVALRVRAQTDVKNVTLTDPLPHGAALLDGLNTMTIAAMPAGIHDFTYRFTCGGNARDAFTDPDLHWSAR